jgi:hypothetical protein
MSTKLKLIAFLMVAACGAKTPAPTANEQAAAETITASCDPLPEPAPAPKAPPVVFDEGSCSK